MKRLKRAFFLMVQSVSFRFRWLKIYYWAEKKIYSLGNITVMPRWYYSAMFHFYMSLLKIHCKTIHKMADKGIHTIPYHIRFDVS